MRDNIVIDIETSGLGGDDKTVEIFAVVIDHNKNMTDDIFHRYLNPQKKMTKESIKIHGLTEDFLYDKPKFKDVAHDFVSFLGESSNIISHNISFDMSFINRELKNSGCDVIDESRHVCTLKMSRRMFPRLKSYSLISLVDYFNINSSGVKFHSAKDDVRMLVELYKRMSI